ncbi:hypothetical protein JYT36_00970 [Bacteroidales bacterium AH-315-N07]|nr:hypothetical protein [Bacteroidales bacterium AH-315-N07]
MNKLYLHTFFSFLVSIILLLGGIKNSYSQNSNQSKELFKKGIKALYSYNFTEVNLIKNTLINEFPNSSDSYFLAANYHWWRIITGEDQIKLSDSCHFNLDKAISLMPTKNNTGMDNVQLFQLISLYAFKARVELLNKNHLKTFRYLNKIIDLLKLSFERENEYDSFNLTSGLYNFLSEYAKKEKPLISPLLRFFPKGGMIKGISQLKSIHQSPDELLSAEANYFLTKIYLEAVPDYKEALHHAEFLTKKYPSNLLYQYFVFKTYLTNDQATKAMEQINTLIIYSNSNQNISVLQKNYYIKYAYYKLGQFFKKKGNLTQAIYCFNKAAKYSDQKNKVFYKILLAKANTLDEFDSELASEVYSKIINESNDHEIKALARKNMSSKNKN